MADSQPQVTMRSGVRIAAPDIDGAARVLTPAALAFIEGLARRFGASVGERLDRRRARQVRFNTGSGRSFCPNAARVRGARRH